MTRNIIEQDIYESPSSLLRCFVNKGGCIRQLLEIPSSLMTAESMDPIENAKSGNVEFFETAGVDEFQNTRDKNLDSVLNAASCSGRLDCCVVIYKRCPELLYIANRGGSTALHHAAWNGNDDIVKFLISAAAKTEVQPNGGRKLLTMVTSTTHRTPLHDAVAKGRLKSAKVLLEADQDNNLLGMLDIANDSAMHMAVKNHNLEIVKLLLETDPGFVYPPNNSGQTPHLIAVQESLSGDSTTATIRKLLIEKQPHGCTNKIGERGRTLLHHATLNGDIKSIEDILEFSPICAELVDNEGQNFIHYAAKLEDERVLRYIMESTNVNGNILNQQDINGNTPFHVVTSRGTASMGLSMVYNPRVDKFAINKKGENALSGINFDYDKRKAGVYGFIDRVDEKYLKDRSDFDLFVGALISTVSFTVGITLPGGYFSEGPHQGNAVLYKRASFHVFVVSNTIALTLSLYAVLNHFCTKHLINTDDIIFQLKVATNCSLGSIFALVIAFISGSYAVLVVSAPLAVTVCVICFCFFCFSLHAIWRMRKQQQRKITSIL